MGSRKGHRSLAAAAWVCGLTTTGTVWGAVVTGQISDSSGTRTLSAAQVEIVETGRRTSAEADGSYRFADLEPGRYTLRATYTGAEPVDTVVEVSGDETVRSDIILGPPGTLENADEDATEIPTILVVGQRANLSSSLSRQRASDSVESVLTRDAIGQFPDQNVAEAVRRAAGVNVLNDQGEGRFISIRGLDPNLNSASINGVRIPSPQSDVRGVALDVVPAELIESIQIKKSLTPEMDADTLGGSIEIKTTSALDRKKPYTAITAEGSYNDLREAWSPKGAFDFSRNFGDFGIAGGVSYYKRRFSTDNVEADGWSESDDGIVYADTVEYRDYDVTRKRVGASLSLDYRVDESTSFYLRGLHSRFDDQEYRANLVFEFDEAPGVGTADSASFASDDGAISVERNLKDRFERQEISSITTGGTSYVDAWTLDYQLAWSGASEKNNGSLDPISFKRDFEEPGELGVNFDYSDFHRPRYAVNAENQALFLDPTEYEFDSVERSTRSDAQDDEVSLKLDFARDFSADSGTYQLKFGGKVRQREKSFDLQADIFDGYDGDFTLADALGQQSFGLADIEPLPGRNASRFVRNNIDAFELSQLDTDFESTVADFEVDEDIYAGYVQGRFESGPLLLIGGVRMERTENDLRGNFVELLEEGAERDGVTLEEDTLFVTPSKFKRQYTQWLPSATLRYETSRELVLRAAAYRSLLRPGIAQIAPRFLVEESEDGERSGEFGNPQLDPYLAWNIDLSAEWYFKRNAVLQIGYFRKDIDDFIVNAQFEGGSFSGVDYDEAVIPINGDKATVNGLEFSYQQSLDFLPSPFDGLLIGFNYTYTDAKGDIGDRDISLPASSRNTYNANLGYEKGPISLRLAAAYRDRYLDELGDDADADRYVDDFTQLDFSAKFRVTPNLQLFGELINITDEPFVAFQRGPVRDRLLQYEEYSFTVKTGLRATF